MSITQFTRFKSDKPEEMIKTPKQAKTIFEKHGVEFLRICLRVVGISSLGAFGGCRHGRRSIWIARAALTARRCDAVRQGNSWPLAIANRPNQIDLDILATKTSCLVFPERSQ